MQQITPILAKNGTLRPKNCNFMQYQTAL